jgi:hypothetical protein
METVNGVVVNTYSTRVDIAIRVPDGRDVTTPIYPVEPQGAFSFDCANGKIVPLHSPASDKAAACRSG